MNAPSNAPLSFPLQHQLIPATIKLEASKSISNRVLILDALSGKKSRLTNLSEARDTRIMQALLADTGSLWDARDAGTTLRFLTAYAALTNQQKTVTGTPRMQQRPLKVLVEALREIGADIEYLKQEGYPPVALKGFRNQRQKMVSISGSVSSQYLSALLMMAPTLPQGLTLTIVGKLMSRPYVNMTLKLMQEFGVEHQWMDHRITVAPQKYCPAQIQIESDWSAASYWYSLVALGGEAYIELLGLKDQSLQGDRQIVDIMEPLGVQTKFTDQGIIIRAGRRLLDEFEFDFSSCPDLAQTVLSLCAVSGVTCKARGLESLRIKETDRILALQTELSKIGAKLQENADFWILTPATALPAGPVTFHTYDDHRMAMALAPLCLKLPLVIEDPLVVNKSYPQYWLHLAAAGVVSE